MSTVPSPSLIDWDATRTVYLERFGTLIDVQPTKEGEAPAFYVLCFQGATCPAAPFVYATFGAPGGELFLPCVIPSSGMFAALEEVAREMPPVEALPELVNSVTLGARTPFRGVLVLPEEEGSFVVPAADGSPRLVRRLLALTSAERSLAWRVPRDALHMLRSTGAMIADPLRDCAVEPEETR
jgi:hypothetical protein